MSTLTIEKYKQNPLTYVSKFSKDELVKYITLANTAYYNGKESGLSPASNTVQSYFFNFLL